MVLARTFQFGVDFHHASQDVRAGLQSLDLEQLKAFVPEAQELLLLKTCNRFEVFGRADEATQTRLQHWLGERLPQGVMVARVGDEAVHHCFRVAGALESMVVGEPQILGQMKQAWREAKSAGTLGTVLDRMCTHGFRVGKRIRRETAIGSQPISVASVAVRLCADAVEGLQDKNVAILGTGHMARAACEYMAQHNPARITVLTRQPSCPLGWPSVVSFSNYDVLEKLIVSADVVLAATQAQDYVLTASHIKAAAHGRVRPLAVADVSLPRNVDPIIGSIPGVNFVDLDEVNARTSAARAHRLVEATAAELIVADELQHFTRWANQRRKAHVLLHLQRYMDSLQQEVAGRYHSPEAQKAAQLMMGKILHQPLRYLTNDAISAEDLERLVGDMFGLSCPRKMERDGFIT
jgi:glutamyl-tRNA reductase